MYVSVNLVAMHLTSADLAAKVEAVLEEFSILSCWLRLEITKTSVVNDLESAGRAIRDLNALGVQLLFDAFGTGYSAPSYLQTLPIRGIRSTGHSSPEWRPTRRTLNLFESSFPQRAISTCM